MSIYIKARVLLANTGDRDSAWEIARTDPGLLPDITKEDWLDFASAHIAREKITAAADCSFVIYVHAWHLDDDGNQTYVEGEEAEGWACYVAIINQADELTGSVDGFDRDFTTHAGAMAFAQRIAPHFRAEIREY